MSKNIYAKLAFTNIRNNRKTYIPYLITSIFTVMMEYMMDNLSHNAPIDNPALKTVLYLAVWVLLLFSVIFLFYTNSFLMKRRKNEIGVYNILGMGKWHIARMLTIETVSIGCVSIVGGIFFGTVLGELMYAIYRRLLDYKADMQFYMSWETVIRTVIIFTCIFLLTLFYNLLQIKLSNTIELLKGGQKGEKEPKTKWILAIVGAVMLGYGYYIALTTKKPLDALSMFFVAVVCVIAGTYALFTAGSIVVLKLLRKNKTYYYQTRHFTAISGMIYRMKQNAVGLANICVLSTMVLVMISTTVSLYIGREDVLRARYPKEVTILNYQSDAESDEKIHQVVEEGCKKYHVEMKESVQWHQWMMPATDQKGHLKLVDGQTDYSTKNICCVYLIPEKEYNKIEGTDVSLKNDELLLFYDGAKSYGKSTIQIEEDTWKVKKELTKTAFAEKSDSRTLQSYYMIVKDRSAVEKYLGTNESFRQIQWQYLFDMKGTKADKQQATKWMDTQLNGMSEVEFGSRWLNKKTFYELYGGLFFIGLYLGSMFLMATVLIIYYKQISEGYDDRERYQIMQKVGMSKEEVKRSIRSQILMVFFIPLLTAVIHIAFAFRVITRLLSILYLTNIQLFFKCTLATVIVFAIFYIIVYVITAKEYYKIVE